MTGPVYPYREDRALDSMPKVVREWVIASAAHAHWRKEVEAGQDVAIFRRRRQPSSIAPKDNRTQTGEAGISLRAIATPGV